MAISVFKTFSSGEVLTASDLNSSLTQIINNGADLVSPFTKNIAAGGFKLTGLAAGSAAGESVRYEQLQPLPGVCEFRLTLTTALPITTADVTGATTVYATPFRGNKIALYDGANWNVRSSAEFSLALGTLTSAIPYDVFCYDNATVPTLEFLAWTNDTTRATALTLQDGVLSKTGVLTRRYLGTFRTTATTTTEDSIAKRFLWNYYNRVRRPMRVVEATASWVYSTATIRQARASTANQLDFVIGYSEDIVSAQLGVIAQNDTGATTIAVGIGLDSTTAFSTGGQFGGDPTPAVTTAVLKQAYWHGFPGVGRHFLSWNEYATASGATTWYGSGFGNPSSQSGIYGDLWA